MEDNNMQAPQLPIPNPDLQSLGNMVGTWKFKGTEIIGHLRNFGEEPSKEIKSRFYDSMGNTFDYVYEPKGDKLII
jgi:hypothetical protein